jgi:hypothetical protein
MLATLRNQDFHSSPKQKSWQTRQIRRGIPMAKNPSDQPSLSVVNLRPPSGSQPPATLGPAGIRLWDAILTDYEISDAGGLALLEQAAAAYDRAERLRIEIDRDGEIIRGRGGIMREHPGLKIELGSRSFVCRTLQRLGINLETVRMGPGRPSGPAWRGRGD